MAATQTEALQTYTALSLLRQDWPGKLILSFGLDDAGCSLAMGALAAGAAVLAVDASPARVREAIHSGCCDFAVNTLEEALRILKNELRQRRPVSVALLVEAEPLLAEVVRRGLLPDCVLLHGAERPSAISEAALAQLAEQGAQVGLWPSTQAMPLASGTNLMDPISAYGDRLEMTESTMPHASERPRILEQLALTLHGEPQLCAAAQRWVALAPRLFPRSRTLWLWQMRQV